MVAGIDGPESSRWRLPDISHRQARCTKPKTDTRTDFQPPQQIHVMVPHLVDDSGDDQRCEQIADQCDNQFRRHATLARLAQFDACCSIAERHALLNMAEYQIAPRSQ